MNSKSLTGFRGACSSLSWQERWTSHWCGANE